VKLRFDLRTNDGSELADEAVAALVGAEAIFLAAPARFVSAERSGPSSLRVVIEAPGTYLGGRGVEPFIGASMVLGNDITWVVVTAAELIEDAVCPFCAAPMAGHDQAACDAKMAAWKPLGLLNVPDARMAISDSERESLRLLPDPPGGLS